MIPPILGGSPGLPLITPRELAMSATGRPAMAPCPQIISGATSAWNSSNAAVQQALEHGAHVVAHAMVRREQVVQVPGVALGLAARRRGAGRPGEPRYVLADALEAVLVVACAVVRHSADAGVRAGTAERLRVHP